MALILSKIWGKKFIPLYYGSSFSYIAATLALTQANFGEYAGDAGPPGPGGHRGDRRDQHPGRFLIRAAGKEAVDKVLPPIITGSVALVIGVTLAGAALGYGLGSANWTVAIITLLATILLSVYLQGKGFFGLIPILLGAIVGYLVSIPFGLVDLSALWALPPRSRCPSLRSRRLETHGPGRRWRPIAIIAIATIPESTAHLYQISLYVDQLADDLGRKRYQLNQLIGLNLVLDGIGDSINGLLGGVAGTNYGENNSLMAITRNYSGPALDRGR